MDTDSRDGLLILMGLAILFGGMFLLAYGINKAKCNNKWERSGFQADYAAFQGCLISKDGKVWLPAENYREIP